MKFEFQNEEQVTRCYLNFEENADDDVVKALEHIVGEGSNNFEAQSDWMYKFIQESKFLKSRCSQAMMLYWKENLYET